MKTGKRGRDYYNRIKDVLDRILEKSNENEAQIANAYLDEIAVLEDEAGYEAPPPPPTTRRLRAPRHATRLDLSWKEGGSAFPRTSSRIGCEYQAVDLPSSDTFEKEQARGASVDSEPNEDGKTL